MDSPQTAKTTTAITNTPSESAILPNSPVFSYISNLSPIKPLKTSHVAQGFPGLSSPPLVFTSPHITPHHEASLFKRQCPQSTSAEVSQHDDSGKKVTSDNDVSSKPITQLSRGLIPSSEECDSEVCVQAQSRSSFSGRADEYLADPVELDCENFEHSAELVLEQANSAPQSSQSGLTDMKKVTSELHNCVDVRENVQMEANAYPSEDLQAKSTSLVKLVETEDKRWVGGRPTIESSDIGSKMCMDYFSEQTQCEHTAPQNVGCHHQNGCSVAPQLLLEPSEMIQEHEDCDENAGAVLNKPFKHTMLHDLEASQNKCGMRRRCLQFEEVHSNTIANSPSPSNLVDSVTKSWSPATPAHSEVLELTCVDSATSSNRQLVNLPESRNSMFSPCSSGKSSLTVSKPSGIGLHLNRVVSAVPKGCGATKRSNQGENTYMSAQRLKSAPNMNCHLLENTKCNSISSNRASTEVGMHESNALVAASFATSESPHDMKPFYNPVLLEPTEHCATPRDKRKFNSEEGSMFEEFNQLSSKKIRKKASGTIDSEGCKRCNCKKTKCLKLYCDCFAAGIYCAEPCACQGCYNRPEYEDTVLETRQQIESRNPYAFASKIVQHVSESPASSVEDKNRLSARHKRGCNCKKSLCVKKYCECYQANVGCSDGCRCEGCKNVFGRKEDYKTVSQKASDDTLEDTNNDKPKVVTTWKGLSNTELYNLRNVAPLTPLCQFSEHGNDALRSQIVCRTYMPSPESDLTVLSSQRADQCAPSVDSRSPLPDALLTATSSSSSETKEWTSGGSGVYSGSQHTLVGSLRWRGSPITPMTRLGSVKFLRGTESEILEDDTPQILKDTCITITPTKAVLVNSPNRKRVSPPHGRLNEIGSSFTAVGLKSSRKFILRGLPSSLPSFPPLTPCVRAKGGNVENKNDFQDGFGK